MTAKEALELFKANALKAGLTEEQIKGTLEVWGSNEAFGKVVLDTFVPRPEVDRALGASKQEVEAAQKRVKEWQDWKEKQADPAYQQNLKGIELLKRYEQTYGPLDADAITKEVTAAAKATGLSKDEVENMLRERDQRYVSTLKSVSKVSLDHYIRFKEPLDLDALEKFAVEKGLPPEMAYKEYVAPRVEELRNAEWEAKLKAAREDAVKDYASKHQLPTDTKPKEPHMIFDYDTLKPKEGVNPERASRDAFMDGYQHYDEPVAKT